MSNTRIASVVLQNTHELTGIHSDDNTNAPGLLRSAEISKLLTIDVWSSSLDAIMSSVNNTN
jgi:hypothetical protein